MHAMRAVLGMEWNGMEWNCSWHVASCVGLILYCV
jgi:hypothetical protein